MTNGKRLGSAKVKPSRRWQLVGFPGPGGHESAGIVDLLAIRKNHNKPKSPFKRGDLFEIILIQIKGGGARRPDKKDNRRLNAVAKYYNAGFGRSGGVGERKALPVLLANKTLRLTRRERGAR